MNKILSVSVAAYNSAKWLKKCLDSFDFDEIIEDIEVLIVNDGSTDDTLIIAEEYARKKPNTFKIINKCNGGHGSTINASRKVAIGKYYKAIDADDWVDKQGIIKLIDGLKHFDADLIYNPVDYVYINNGVIELTKTVSCVAEEGNVPKDSVVDFDEFSKKLNISIHGMTIRTDLIKYSNYEIDENCFYVDQEYIIFYLQNVKSLVVFDYPVYKYLNGRVGQSIDFQSYIKRRDQHRRVIDSIISFLETKHDSFGNNTLQMLYNHVAMLVCIQYKIYMYFPDKKMAKMELILFDQYMKSKGKDIHKYALKRGRIVKGVNIISKIYYVGYGVLKFLILRLNQ